MIERSVLKSLGDVELEVALKSLLNDSARIEARVVVHLAELDERRLHLRAGFPSLFRYCLGALGLSEFEAVFRITAARLGRKFPLIFELLERREIHLSAVHLLRYYLTEENHRELLAQACHKSKRQVELLLAHRFPHADVPTSLRELQRLDPLAPDRYRLELTIDEETKRDLERACELLSHVSPAPDYALVVKRGVRALVEQLEKRRLGKRATKKREPSPTSEHERMSATEHEAVSPKINEAVSPEHGDTARSARKHIANHVRRAVAERDDECCTFVSPDGRRCGSRRLLQLHHEQPWARGGADTPDNLRLLCAEHNRLLAERDFGTGHLERARALRFASTHTNDLAARTDESAGSAVEPGVAEVEHERDVALGEVDAFASAAPPERGDASLPPLPDKVA